MWRDVLVQEWRLLTFRRAAIRLDTQRTAYLSFAVAATWLAGIGRYWDHPSAGWWQSAGLGSLAYSVVLAAIIFVVVLPLRPRRWSYLGVLVFVGLTAPPAWLYAIPVERFLSMDTAASVNLWFLLVVAAWRVALYAVFLGRAAGLTGIAWVSCLLLPLTAIVTALSALNLEHAVFEIMGGVRDPTAADRAYGVVIGLTLLSWVTTPFLLAGYLYAVWRARSR